MVHVGHVKHKPFFIRATFHAYRTRESGQYAALVFQMLVQSVFSFVISATFFWTIVPAVAKFKRQFTAKVFPLKKKPTKYYNLFRYYRTRKSRTRYNNSIINSPAETSQH